MLSMNKNEVIEKVDKEQIIEWAKMIKFIFQYPIAKEYK